MITQQNIDQFYVDFEKMKVKKPVATMMALVPGLSSGNVSEYLSGKKPPSERFIKAFYDHVYKSSISGLEEDLSLRIIDSLSRTMEKYADAHLILAKKINLNEPGKASLIDGEAHKGIAEEELPLSGNKANVKKRRGT